MAADIFIAVVGVITSITVARTLGPEGRGELSVIQSWPTFLATLGLLGFPEAMVYFAASKKYISGVLLASGMLFSAAGMTILCFLAWFAIPWILPNHSSQMIDSVRIYMVGIMLLYLFVSFPPACFER